MIEDSPKTLLAVNPAAGHGRGKKVYRALSAILEQSIPGLETVVSSHSGHTREIGRQAALRGIRRLICLGGDGTPFEVLNGYYSTVGTDRRLELGLIPAGTGNSFLRDFNISEPRQALNSILSGRKRPVDLMEFNCRTGSEFMRFFSLNLVGIGLIADILELTNQRFKFLGPAGYSLAVLVSLARGLRNELHISGGGRTRQVLNSALVINNSRYTGGRMLIAPGADPADGLAELVLFNQVKRRDIVGIFRRVFSGTHTEHPKVERISCPEFNVSAEPDLQVMADGELLGRTPLQLRVHQGLIDLLA